MLPLQSATSRRFCRQRNALRPCEVSSEMTNNHDLDTDQKVLSIQKEIEEATALELPMLEKNLVFLSTISSCATLLGLFGTVMGMIRSFSAMSQAGAPDAGCAGKWYL